VGGVGWFFIVVLAHGWILSFIWCPFLFVCLNLADFFALYGQVTFTLLAQRKVTKRKSTRMLAQNKDHSGFPAMLG